MRSEWDETKQHDVLFLLTVQPPDQVALGALRDRGEEPTPAQQHGLIYVRGAEVIEVRLLNSMAAGMRAVSRLLLAPCHITGILDSLQLSLLHVYVCWRSGCSKSLGSCGMRQSSP